MNTPNLRFPEFKGNWDVNKLGKIMEFKKGSSLSKADLTNVGEPCILYGELYTKYGAVINKVMSRTNRLLSSPVIGRKNDVLIPSSGESAIDIACASTIDTNENVILGGDLNVLTPHGGINGKFISYQINGVRKAKLSKFAQGASVVHLYNDSLKNFEILLPTMEEQEKIANFFTLLDRRIEKQQEKVEALREYKKGMLQKIFSRELRFKDENGEAFPEWEEKLLGDVSEVTTGNKDTKDKIDYGKYPFFVRSSIVERINSFSFDGEAILTAGDGVGVGKVFHYINGKFDYHQRVYMLSNFQNCDGKYIYYYFSMNFLREAMKYNAKTSVDSVRREMITKMLIPFPILKEQQKIADFLSKLDEKIEKEEVKLEALQEQKKGFMQQMFI